MSATITVKPAETEEEKALAFHIRTEVFVKEQNVPVEIEMDKFDKVAKHYLCFLNQKPVGTARVRKTDRGYKLERFAVLKHVRKKGAGQALVISCMADIPVGETVFLYSQVRVTGFYEKLGFTTAGNVFFEAEIPHVKMVHERKTQ